MDPSRCGLTFAIGKNLETCASPGRCCQPAVVEREFYQDDDDTAPVTLGFCIAHESEAL